MSKSSRIFVFDLLRILLIIPVVHLHLHILIVNPEDFFSRFEYYSVPLFIVLSFYLTAKYYSKEHMSFENLKKRIKRFIIPLIFWSCIGFLPQLELLTLPNFFLQIFTGAVVNTPLYYLNMMILFTCLLAAISHLKPKWKVIVFSLILFTAFALQYSSLNYLAFTHFIDPIRLSYGRFFEFLPYVMMGLLFSWFNTKILENFEISIVLFITGIVGYVITMRSPVPLGFAYQGLSWFFGSLTMFLVVLHVAQHDFSFMVGEKVFKIVDLLGKYTFGVYLFHFIALVVLLKYSLTMRLIAYHYTIPFVFIFLVACYVVCILFDNATKHRFSVLFK